MVNIDLKSKKIFTWKRNQKSSKSRRRFIALGADSASAGPGMVRVFPPYLQISEISAWVTAHSKGVRCHI